MTVGAWRTEVGRGRNAPHDARAVQTRESRHERVGEEGRLQTAVPVAPLERRSPKAWLSPQRVRATGGDPCVEGCAKLQTSRGRPPVFQLSLSILPLHRPSLQPVATPASFLLRLSLLGIHTVTMSVLHRRLPSARPAARRVAGTRHGDSWDREVQSAGS